MGYVHTTDISTFISPFLIGKTQGNWPAFVSSNVVSQGRSASVYLFSLAIPLQIPGARSALQGSKIISVEVYYKIATAATNDFSFPEISKITLPATGAAPAGAALACTMDDDHVHPTLLSAIGDHTMTATLNTPVFLDADYAYYLTFIITPVATTLFTLFGAKINYELRL
jgi:hypothetical protein